jgi:hypothetical protein
MQLFNVIVIYELNDRYQNKTYQICAAINAKNLLSHTGRAGGEAGGEHECDGEERHIHMAWTPSGRHGARLAATYYSM